MTLRPNIDVALVIMVQEVLIVYKNVPKLFMTIEYKIIKRLPCTNKNTTNQSLQ